MSAIDTEIEFAALLARAARDRGLDAGLFDAPAQTATISRPWLTTLYVSAIVSALAILSVVTVFAGWSALTAADPVIWVHRLMALSLAQSILFAAMIIKLAPISAFGRQTTRIGGEQNFPLLEQAARAASIPSLPLPPPPPSPVPAPAPRTAPPERPSLVGRGELAGREYIEYSDGSIEIDTMLGRRRFKSLDIARAFVGA